MLRSRALEYAILSAAEVATQSDGKPGPGVQAHKVAQTYELPTAYAGKIMSQLAKAQVLRSVRGPNGGSQLARAANKITLLEIYEAVNGKLGQDTASALPSSVAKPVNAAFDATYNLTSKRLGATTLADLMKR